MLNDRSVCVLGTGYVGLPLCVMLARSGYSVLGVDVQEDIVEAINQGNVPFEEAALADAFDHPLVRANLRASLSPERADIFVVAVPTPLDHRKRSVNLTYVESAVGSILPYLRADNLVIIESTVPPLTCRDVIVPMIESTGLRVGEEVMLAHCPERILPGDIVYEIVHNDRLIGGVTSESTSRARELYESFVEGELFETDDVTAEMCKLMENTYRDVNVALANEFASLSETLGVDVLEAIELANRHPRVDILKPGTGTGGHCIPVDPWFIWQVDPNNARLIEVARRVNDEVPDRIAARIRRAVADLPAPHLAVVGVSYKPNTADCRESPALRIVESLRMDGFDLEVYDPFAPSYPWPEEGLLGVARGADSLLILVEHATVRRELDELGEEIRQVMRTPRIMRFYEGAVEKPAPWQSRGVATVRRGRV